MKKNPRFFCDNCGKEVGQNTKACAQCGRFFASIRCPACGFSGEDANFSAGCPSCGYSAPPSAQSSAPRRFKEKKVRAGPLPLWVYIVSICAFIAVFAYLIYRLVN